MPPIMKPSGNQSIGDHIGDRLVIRPWRVWQLASVVLIAVFCLIGVTGATSMPYNLTYPISNRVPSYYCHITAATLTGTNISVTYTCPLAILKGGMETALFCPDSQKQNMSFWEGDSDKSFGTWGFDTSIIPNMPNVSKCWLMMVNATAGST